MFALNEGGTVDIAVHEVLEDNMLRELHQATGGSWGGNTVTENFLEIIAQAVGEDVYRDFVDKNKHDYLELMKEIEEKKRKGNPDSQEKISIKLPSALLRAYETKNKQPFGKNSTREDDKDPVSFIGDKLRITSKKFVSLFAAPVQDIIAHIHDLLESIRKPITVLLMVGGFSDSPVLRKKVRQAFGERMKVVIPTEASLSVAKGAVLYAFEPGRITERVIRYTYGIDQTVSFKPSEHPVNRKSLVGKKAMVDGVFDIHVRVGDVVKYGEFQTERVYYPVTPNDLDYSVMLYRSNKTEPKFTDEEGCHFVGYYFMSRPYQKGTSTKDEAIKVKLAFGHSDIQAKVTAHNGEEVMSEFKL